MTPKAERRLSEILRWTIMIGALIGGAWAYNWNEYDSPWGKQIQAAKLEMLKAELCK